MGNVPTTQNNSSTAYATPQEQQLQSNEAQVSNANVGNQMSVNNNSASLINSILTGNYQGGAGGITPGQNQSIVNQSLRDIAPQFQTSGILDSGEAGQVATQTAALTSNANAQFNTQAQSNLLSAGLGGSTNWSSENTSANQVLGSQLAGLRTVNSNQQNLSNPFLQSFYSQGGKDSADFVSSAAQAALAAAASCWVASEIFGGWYAPKTVLARFYINNIAPKWFKNLYLKYGERIAEFIHNKPILKIIIKPLFEMFVVIAKGDLYGGYVYTE
jgi:hypothetical protein